MCPNLKNVKIDMKKQLFVSFSMVLLTLIWASCTNKKVEILNFQYADTTAYASVTLELELPISGDKKAMLMRDSILNIFFANLKESGYEDIQKFNLPEKAQEADFLSLMDSYGQQILNSLSESAAPFAGELGSKWEYNLSMTPLMDTIKYAVYSCSGDMFMGGTSVQIIGSGTVLFDKTKSAIIHKIIAENTIDSLQPILRKGLLSYYAENGEEMTDKQLFEHLQIVDENGSLLEQIPLPADCPSLSYDGVGFYYEEGEIAAAEDGVLNFVVPFEEITPYLTTEVQALLK